MSKKYKTALPHAGEVAEAVRNACLEAALKAYEEASISGLCHEGAWECAVGAIRDVDLDDAVRKVMERRSTGPDSAPEER
jgi:hypothetical protein